MFQNNIFASNIPNRPERGNKINSFSFHGRRPTVTRSFNSNIAFERHILSTQKGGFAAGCCESKSAGLTKKMDLLHFWERR